MKKIKIIFSLTLFLFLFIFSIKLIDASEGTFELRSTVGQESRCFAASLLMQDRAYTILITCRDLIYPAEFDLTNYILWAQPIDGSKAVNLGQLGYGKATVRTTKAFSSLFVTTEGNPGVREPAGKLVMKGNNIPVTFLESPTSPTLSPEAEEGKETEGEAEKDVSETKNLSTKEKLFLALRRAGIAALLALVALIGLIFVVTRARG